MSFAVPEYQYVVANNRVLLLPLPDERRTLGALRFTRSA
jgi:hypothetical protein